MRASWHIVDDGPRPIDPGGRSAWLADFPPWRGPGCMAPTVDRRAPDPGRLAARGERYRLTGGAEQLDRINAALRLRRPLVVTGPPGSGKSSLAWWLAAKLDLGRVLTWGVTPSSTLGDALYRWDGAARASRPTRDWGDRGGDPGCAVRLGPLGTALLPTPLPRVLLVDDLDLAAPDVAIGLARVLDEGAFEVGELGRVEGTELAAPDDAAFADDRVALTSSRVAAFHLPVVVITAAAHEALPGPLLRRCVPLALQRPDDELLAEIAAAWLGEESVEARALRAALAGMPDASVDRMLQALYLLGRGAEAGSAAAAVGERA